MSKPALTVWCLSDGRPGHFNQSKGLIQALERGYDVRLHWIDCSLQAKPLRPILRQLLNAELATNLMVKLHRFERPDTPPDLILSTGGNTAYLNIALARQLNCPNWFIGSLRGLKPSLFHRVFTIEALNADNNIVMPLAPVPSNRQDQQNAAIKLRQEQGIPTDQTLWTLLIGGSTEEYSYSDQNWSALAAQMNTLAEQHDIRWLVTSSRRTGIEVEQKLASQLSEPLLADTTWFCQQPRKVMAAYLGAADIIFCSEDSLSMLTEGIASGKAVVSLYPPQHQPAERYKAALERLEQRCWLERQPMAEISAPSGEQADIDPTEDLWQRIESSVPAAR